MRDWLAGKNIRLVGQLVARPGERLAPDRQVVVFKAISAGEQHIRQCIAVSRQLALPGPERADAPH